MLIQPPAGPQTVLLTGGTSGLGYASAQAMAALQGVDCLHGLPVVAAGQHQVGVAVIRRHRLSTGIPQSRRASCEQDGLGTGGWLNQHMITSFFRIFPS